MLKKTMPFALFAAVALWAVADNAARLTVLFRDGTSTVVDMDVDDEVTLDHEGGTLVLPQGVTYPLADIASFFFDEPEGGAEGGEVEPSDDLTTVYVEWTEGAAPRVRSSAPGIIVQTDGQHVSLNNTDTTSEITYVLSGAASNASFTLVAEYKSTIRLDGVSLASDAGAAINILCGKRIALELVEGTTSVLSDASEDFGQKAALYCKGHLEVSGGGNLQLTGHVKHALSTKEYLQLKRTTGTIEVLSAASDGLHAGQYFLMNGGDVRISSVGGDGIQAEITDDPADEQNGQLIINGGTLDISIAGTDVAALKSDSLLTVNDGEFKLTTSGEGAKGVKSKTDICLLGGTFRISQQGNPYILDGETTYVAAIKGNNVTVDGADVSIDNSAVAGRGISTDNDATIASGTVCVSMTGAGGRGVKSDHDIIVGRETDGNGPALSVTTTGGVYTPSSAPSAVAVAGPGGGGWFHLPPSRLGHSSKLDGSRLVVGWPGGGGWPPGGNEGGNGSAAKAIKADNTYWQHGGDVYVKTTGTEAEGIEAKANSATAMNFNGGTAFRDVYDDCINSAGQINFNGTDVICFSTGNDAIDSNYGRTGAVTVSGGTVVAFSQRGGSECGIDCDNMSYVVVSGGTVVAGGGSQGGGGSSSSLSAATVASRCWSSSLSYTQGSYYSIAYSDGNILTWKMPCTVNSSYNIFATDAVSKGITCTLSQHADAPLAEGTAFMQPSGASTMLWKGNGGTTGTQKTTISL